MKGAFVIFILYLATNALGANPFSSEGQNLQETEQKKEITKNFLAQNVHNMSFDEALERGENFAKEYLYAWGASISFTRQDRDANLRVLCEKIGSFLLITALKQENYKIIDFLKDHGADMDKIRCCIMPLDEGIK
ncbi:MAG: hypothetical protein J6P84_01375 [Alphaproteobacteria bacterium]|nr:hypothetical protein [Alphaproteobacteria bacterium]MBO7642342.1 hypothetical protein [Alphaproteobacteria bacterium]